MTRRRQRREDEVFNAVARGVHYTLDIARVTRMRSGSLYPVLYRLEAAGKLRSEWEPDKPNLKLRRRRYYTT